MTCNEREGRELYYYDGKNRVSGPHIGIMGDSSNIYGDCSDIWGNVTYIVGDVSSIRGDVTSIRGDVSNIEGNVSNCRGAISKCSGVEYIRQEAEMGNEYEKVLKRIYIAGKLSSDAVDYLKNVSIMMEYANKIRKMGYSVFVPAIDLLMGIKFGNWEYNDYFNNGVAWLEVADAIFLVPGWENSNGVRKEIEIAKENGIMILNNLDILNRR